MVWELTKEQQEKYRNTYLKYMENYEDFTKDFIQEIIKDYNSLKDLLNTFVTECKETDFKKTIEYVYNSFIHEESSTKGLNQIQTVKDVLEYEYWDMDFRSITATIYIDPEHKTLSVSEFVNGYTEIFTEPFEDLYIPVLQQMLDKK
jgi:hypothetical protein